MEPIELDVHVHQVPIDLDRLAALSDTRWDQAQGHLEIDGRRIALAPLFKPERLIVWMDENAVRRAWISVPPPVYRQHLDAERAEGWARYLNDGLHALSAQRHDRFEALMHLPVEHPELCVAIVRRWLGSGINRFAMPAGAGPTVSLSDRAYEPLWSLLSESDAFLFLHPAEAGFDARLAPFYLQNTIGNPIETAIAAAHLVFGRVLERYRGLKICLAHCGGAAAMVAGRMSRSVATERPGIDAQMMAPDKALQRLWVDCIAHSVDAVTQAATVFGADHIVFGSDWPFPMGLIKPHDQLAALPLPSQRRVFSENPAALMRGK